MSEPFPGFNRDAAVVRQLAHKHFGPVQSLSDADVARIKAAFAGQRPMSMKRVLDFCKEAGIEADYRQLKPIHEDMFFAAWRRLNEERQAKSAVREVPIATDS